MGCGAQAFAPLARVWIISSEFKVSGAAALPPFALTRVARIIESVLTRL